MADYDLAGAFAQWTDWHWQMESFDSWSLLLIADNDLSYHHSLEVVFEGVTYLRCPSQFEMPTWKAADDGATRLAAQLEGYVGQAQPDSSIPFAWDVEIASGNRVGCLVVAEQVRILEGHWPHRSDDRAVR